MRSGSPEYHASCSAMAFMARRKSSGGQSNWRPSCGSGMRGLLARQQVPPVSLSAAYDVTQHVREVVSLLQGRVLAALHCLGIPRVAHHLIVGNLRQAGPVKAHSAEAEQARYVADAV